MRIVPIALLSALLYGHLAAQATPARSVHDGTLTSKADPAGEISVDRAFAFAGAQVIDILKVAGAEQYFFVDAAADRSIRRFFWVQFEHLYPKVRHAYDYSSIPQKPVQIGRLAFMGDVGTHEHYFTMDDRPGSDSKAAENFLRAKGYNLDGTFVRLRLFHLPDDSRRRELMIIYGERLPDGAKRDAVEAAITARAQGSITLR